MGTYFQKKVNLFLKQKPKIHYNISIEGLIAIPPWTAGAE
jgi:hypothetical protein